MNYLKILLGIGFEESTPYYPKKKKEKQKQRKKVLKVLSPYHP